MGIVFADVAGFGAMTDNEVQVFASVLLPECTRLAQDRGAEYCNTWGDAIVAYFSSLGQSLEYALQLRDLFRNRSWNAKHGEAFRTPPTVRIAMHMADVYISEDEATPGGKIFGAQVSFAARIEPITTPNEVFASEVVVSALRAEKHEGVAFTSLGYISLPKENHRERIFWIRRAGEKSRREVARLKAPPLRILQTTEQVTAEIASGPKIRSLKVLTLNGGSSMHALLGVAEAQAATKCQISILVYDPDCTNLSPPSLADGSFTKCLVDLRAQLPDPFAAKAACEYLMQASELTAWSDDPQEAQAARLKERLSTCVKRSVKGQLSARLLKSPRWVPARCWLIDDRAYITNYWQPSVLAPIIAVEKPHPMFEAIQSHFDYVWLEADQSSESLLFEADSAGVKGAGRKR